MSPRFLLIGLTSAPYFMRQLSLTSQVKGTSSRFRTSIQVYPAILTVSHAIRPLVTAHFTRHSSRLQLLTSYCSVSVQAFHGLKFEQPTTTKYVSALYLLSLSLSLSFLLSSPGHCCFLSSFHSYVSFISSC